MSKEVKNPLVNHKTTALSDRQRQEPARQYVDLTTGKICVDYFQQTPKQETEDPNVHIESEANSGESWKLAKPYRPQSGDRTKAVKESRKLVPSDVADNAQKRK